MCTTEKWYKDCCYWNMKKGLTGECLPKSKKQYYYFLLVIVLSYCLVSIQNAILLYFQFDKSLLPYRHKYYGRFDYYSTKSKFKYKGTSQNCEHIYLKNGLNLN